MQGLAVIVATYRKKPRGESNFSRRGVVSAPPPPYLLTQDWPTGLRVLELYVSIYSAGA